MLGRLLGKPGLERRLFLIMAVTVIALVIPLGYLIATTNGQILTAHQESSQIVVESAVGVVEGFQARERAGELSRPEAQRQAMATLKTMRFENGNYVWVQNDQPKMLMHPVKPEMDGKDLTEAKDANGNYLFRDFVRIAKTQGAGYHRYVWPKPGEAGDVSKSSYVKAFAPWGWIVGSGVYLDDVEAPIRRNLIIAIGAALCAMGLSYIVSRRVINGMAAQVAELQAGFQRMVKGDLSREVVIPGDDEMAVIAKDVNTLMATLRGEFRSIAESAERAASGAVQLATTSQGQEVIVGEVSKSAKTLEDASREMFVSVGNLGLSLEQVEMSVKNSTERARGAVKSAEKGHAAGDATKAAMTEIDAMTQQIAEAVQTIEDIANQTNMLSLNAAIEAARAGVAGKGFAVVADEVRRLSERSSEAANAIRELNEQTSKAMDRGNATVSETVLALGEIQEAVDAVAGVLAAVDKATIAQVTNVLEVQKGVATMSSVAKQNNGIVANIITSFHEVVQTSAEVARVADSLAHTLQKFEIDEPKAQSTKKDTRVRGGLSSLEPIRSN